jgi:hypothetical protein
MQQRLTQHQRPLLPMAKQQQLPQSQQVEQQQGVGRRLAATPRPSQALGAAQLLRLLPRVQQGVLGRPSQGSPPTPA